VSERVLFFVGIMKTVRCQSVRAQIDSRSNIYLMLVSEDCPFCQEVLDNFEHLHLAFDTLVVNTDACGEDIDSFIDAPAVPMIVHFRDGKEVGRGVGVEGIMTFHSGDEEAQPVKKESNLVEELLANGVDDSRANVEEPDG
jgi:hypothetical protein